MLTKVFSLEIENIFSKIDQNSIQNFKNTLLKTYGLELPPAEGSQTVSIKINEGANKVKTEDQNEKLNFKKVMEMAQKAIEEENDILNLEKIYNLVVKYNRGNKALYKLEAYLLAKAALLASGAKPAQIRNYLNKIDMLFKKYHQYIHKYGIKAKAPIHKLKTIHDFLWRGEKRKKTYARYKFEHRFDRVLDNQLKYLKNRRQLVGNCLGLTTLFSVMSSYLGVRIKSKRTPGHILSEFRGREIENTNAYGSSHKKYKKSAVSVEGLFFVIADILYSQAFKSKDTSESLKLIETGKKITGNSVKMTHDFEMLKALKASKMLQKEQVKYMLSSDQFLDKMKLNPNAFQASDFKMFALDMLFPPKRSWFNKLLDQLTILDDLTLSPDN